MLNKISYKLMTVVGGVAALVLGLFAYLILGAYQQRLIGGLEQTAEQLSETVKRSTRYEMLLNQRESVHEIINTIGAQTGIDRVRIFNKDGEVIYSSDSLDIGGMVDKDTEACYACHAADQPLVSLPIFARTRIFNGGDGQRILGIINPINNEPGCWQSSCHAHDPEQTVLGVLDITMPLDAVDREKRDSEVQMLLLTLLAVAGISLLIYWLTGRIVLKPVGQIVDATERVAAGDLTHPIPIKQDDEIGQLARSFNDMTRKLSEAQRQLFQSDKLASVGRLAAGVAHEINNPLTGVLTYSSLLLNSADEYPALKEDLEVIVRETKRCRDIVRSLLDFSRQSSSTRHQIDLNEAVHNAVRIVHNQLSLHKVRLVLDLQQDLPSVYADHSRIEQVLVNLLVNAGDAMPKDGGTVTLETALMPDDEPAGRYVRLVARDTGGGISAEDRTKIFEPFFTTKGQKGTGLGLAIVWGIIEEHEGRITVDSTLGEGTTFTIMLPVAGPAPPTAHGNDVHHPDRR